MQKTQDPMSIVLPERYLQKLEAYRKRFFGIQLRRKRGRRATITNRCKQAINLSDKMYCGILREHVDNAICNRCPYYDDEPTEYSLFRRG